MTLLNDRHPNELFRFMHVRGPQRASDEKIPTFFVTNIYDQISKTTLAAIQRSITTLYPTLAKRIGKSGQLSKQIADVTAYQESQQYIGAPDEYARRYSEQTSFLNWLDVNISATTSQAVGDKIKVTTGQDVNGYVKSLEFKTLQCVFWDNLIASLFLPNDPLLMTMACKYLAGLHLAEVIARNIASEDDLPDLTSVYHAKSLAPKWVFEILSQADRKPDEGVGDQQRSSDGGGEALKTRFHQLNHAIQEMRTLIAKREEVQRVETVLPALKRTDAKASGKAKTGKHSAAFGNLKSIYDLTPKERSEFSKTTTQLIKESSPQGTVRLDTFLNILAAEAAAVATQLGSSQREYAARVGDTIIKRSDLCVDAPQVDPCAIRPRKAFASTGSYTNGWLIGDLLVTRQQLIKYDAGEIAHVEAVMQGLDKERTHRRLNRTESTTTVERESVNETERETQTTERYSMEKETAKTLNQDFKIDTGSNFTATYGPATFGASLNASFGVSQSQSQKTATSFSKEVTNRALSRVKETVRESQTVTILNEVEETSLNKLLNNTGDHLNGVYRWLDKFYLNKIINYGKRLMFEFTIPEPANFYIFRRMTKPHMGAVVENPVPPSETIGPDGKRLTSPAVLDDANFGFWTARYEAANVAAPPNEYETISYSFKSPNEIDTANPADLYSTFTGTIPIDKGYEAISAFTHVESTELGSTAFFNGIIGTAAFSVGYWSMGLPNIQTDLAIAVSSRATDYACGITVRTKRTPELLSNWALDAYGKIMEAYNRKKQAYDEWLNAQYADTTFGFTGSGSNPDINRATEREELKMRCLELFTGQRFESFDAATNGIQNVSGYPEILFREAIAEGNLAKFFEQAFEWENITYIFYPYFWGRKENWPTIKNLEETSDPLFTKFLQAGTARVQVPARPGFENYLLLFNMLSNFVTFFVGEWFFTPSIFGAIGISNEFTPGIDDPVYMSVTQELTAANNLDEESGTIIGSYVQKVPTNLVYVIPLRDGAGNPIVPSSPLPGLPDNSADPEIQPFLVP